MILGGLANSAVLHSSLMTVLWITCSHPRRSGVGCAVSWTWCCKWESSILAVAKGDQHQFNLFSCSRNLKKLLRLRLIQWETVPMSSSRVIFNSLLLDTKCFSFPLSAWVWLWVYNLRIMDWNFEGNFGDFNIFLFTLLFELNLVFLGFKFCQSEAK